MTIFHQKFAHVLTALGLFVLISGCGPQETTTVDTEADTSVQSDAPAVPDETEPAATDIDGNVDLPEEPAVEPGFTEEEMAEEPEAAEAPAEPEPAAEEEMKEEETPEESEPEETPSEPEPAPAKTPDTEDFSPEDIDDDDASDTAEVTLGDPSLTGGIPGEGSLTVDEIRAWLDNAANHLPLKVALPLGLAAGAGQIKGIEANPLTRAKIELGRQLYFDTRLSSDNTISCASCHSPDEGYARHTQFGVGVDGQEGDRNSPVSYNRILSDAQFWDGRAGSLEEQAVGPIANPIEMGNTHEAVVKTLAEIEGYAIQFDRVFGELNIDAVGKAIASFERTLVTGPSPYDYYERLQQYADIDAEDLEEDDPELFELYKTATAAAEENPMSESAQRGYAIYFNKGAKKGHCSACHVGPNLTDELYHNLGVGMLVENPAEGRAAVTKDPADQGAFKTPTIRNVELSAPYMHDGSEETLEAVVDYYVEIGKEGRAKYPNLSEKIKPLDDLNDQDKQDLVAFMKACTGDFPVVETARLPE